MANNRFSAVASALGYAYQFRYALAVALRRLPSGIEWTISVETADDVEVSGVTDHDLLQLKLHSKATVLTDLSVDAWKTLRIWSEGLKDGTIDRSTNLLLITTAAVSDDSAFALLGRRADQRDSVQAATILTAAADTSKNAALVEAFNSFRSLSVEQRDALLDAVTVVGSEPDMGGLDSELSALCAAAVHREHLVPFLERLEGWWFRRCLQQIATPGDQISAEEIEGFFADLREQFFTNNLPIDVDETPGAVPQPSELESRVFVRQLDLATVGDPRIRFAIRDYFRAFNQRSRWSRDGLLLVGELDRYERRLVEEWELVFAREVEDVGAEAAEEAMVAAAREIYRWVESTDFAIRPACSEPFLTRGSYQILADEMRVGWHPDFEARLVALLEPKA